MTTRWIDLIHPLDGFLCLIKPTYLPVSSNADHAGGDDRRSVSGWAVMLNGAMISWASKCCDDNFSHEDAHGAARDGDT